MLIVFLNVFSCKESSTLEYCILIAELSYTNHSKGTQLDSTANSTEKHFYVFITSAAMA
jgi:hypothetical protein